MLWLLVKTGTPLVVGCIQISVLRCHLVQMESTLSIQALKPRMDELKAKYENDPETLQLETARLYKAAGVNPLAGCLPTLATIPVFIGLYRWDLGWTGCTSTTNQQALQTGLRLTWLQV